jgi:heterodisulfide reductase subunit D
LDFKPKDATKEQAEYLYFVGCTAALTPEIQTVAINTAKVLKKLGIDFSVLGEHEVCCGSVAKRTGDMKAFNNVVNKNYEIFKKSGAKKIITSCAGCYRTLLADYTDYLEDLGIEVIHSIELIIDFIKENNIQFKNLGIKATYHDPCHTGRHFAIDMEQEIIEKSKNLMFDKRKIDQKIAEWFEVPRVILRKLEEDVGLKFTEMYRIKLNSMCCGAGGGVRAGYPDFSLRTASLRCDEANAVEADFLLTECPFCWRNLYDANELYDHGLIVMGVLQMILEYDLLDIIEKPTEKDLLE